MDQIVDRLGSTVDVEWINGFPRDFYNEKMTELLVEIGEKVPNTNDF